jgi:hypothetical protein
MLVAAAPVAAAALLAIDIAETVLIQIVGQLVSSTIGAALAPELLELQQESFRLTNTRALDPGAAVDAYVRGHRSAADAQNDVAAAGYDGELFQVMAATAGEPLPLLMAMQAWRRGFVALDDGDPLGTSVRQVVKESRLFNKYFDVVSKLQFELAPVGVVIEGWLRRQIAEANARKILYQQGVDDDTASLMYATAGRPLSPQEAATAWHRGVIPETGTGQGVVSLEQSFYETDIKDKYLPAWKAILEYRPPPRTITALHRAGSITDEQALKMYQDEGLSAELAAIYVKTAHHEKHAGAKELTKAEWIALYVDQAIDAAELRKRLATLGFQGEGADLEIQLADLKIEHALKQRAINRVGSLYVGRRISKQQALATLDTLKLPAKQRDRLLEVWTAERSDNLKHLTLTELGHAVQNDWLTADQALEIIAGQGYGPRDAWIALNIHLKGALGKTPPSDNLPPA